MLSIFGFLVILGPLVIFHEFGHYIFAKIFNVKAEIFSIGFGPRLWSKKIGETEWRLSLIPMGGFVKLMGDDGNLADLPLSEQLRSLPKQAPWKRFFIFFGGPLFNFILAVFVFMAILAIGEPQMSSVIGRVVHGSVAEKVGFQTGDQVSAINGAPIKRFEEIILAIMESPKKAVEFEIHRPLDLGNPAKTSTMTLKVTPQDQQGISIYGESTRIGEVEGLYPSAREAAVGVSNPKSLAGKAGIHTGDRVIELNQKPVASWEHLEQLYAAVPEAGQVSMKIESTPSKSIQADWKKPVHAQGLGADFGLHSTELFIEKTVPNSPAEAIGIKPGDRMVGVGNQDVISFFQLKEWVQDSGEKNGKVSVRWERDGRIQKAEVVPTSTTTRDALLKKSTQFTVGLIPMLIWKEPVTFIERTWNPFVLIVKATERMFQLTWRNVVSIKKMFTGDVSLATLGGPILIGKLAGESISRGLIAFLSTMAVLSVGLGILNVLPVPVLDGGHILLLFIEVIRGKPLAMKQMELAQQVGLALILMLMVVVIKNDLTRLPFFN